MSTSQIDRPSPDALGIVTSSMVNGFNRMVYLLFTGPNATVPNWFWWGLMILLSGLMSGGYNGSSNWSEPGGSGSDWNWRGAMPGMAEGFGLVAVITTAVCCVLAIVLVFLYIQSRFRFVMLESVIVGEPRIKATWGRTSEVGLQYFVWELIIGLLTLLLLAPVFLLWLPVITSAVRGGRVDEVAIFGRIFLTIGLVLPVVIAKAVVDWFVYDLTVPLTWRVTGAFRAGLARSWQLLTTYPAAVFLMLLLRFLVGIVGGIVTLILICVTCCVWLLPIGAIVLLAIATGVFPPALVLTIPLMIVLAFGVGWLFGTIAAPVFVFYRCWSFDFVRQLDASAGGWDDGGASGGIPPSPAGPPAAPPSGGWEPEPGPYEPPPAEPEPARNWEDTPVPPGEEAGREPPGWTPDEPADQTPPESVSDPDDARWRPDEPPPERD